MKVQISKPTPNIILHCRQCRITRAVFNHTHESHVDQKNFVTKPVPATPADGPLDPETYKGFLRAALDASDAGELVIPIPPAVQSAMNHFFRTEETTNPNEQKMLDILLRVEYELVSPRGGVHFILPDSNSGARYPRT